MKPKKRGQVWVETVIYTLIGLSIIAIVLSVSKPKIDEKKDELAIEQAIEALGIINKKIIEVKSAPGNRRVIDLTIGKGSLSFDMESNSIYWELDSKFEYSETDLPVMVGNIKVITTGTKPWKVHLESSQNSDILFNEKTTGIKTLTENSNPYKLTVENNGRDNNGKIILLFREV